MYVYMNVCVCTFKKGRYFVMVYCPSFTFSPVYIVLFPSDT